MMFDTNKNYCILSNATYKSFLDKYSEYTIINDDKSYNELIDFLSEYLNKTIIFNESLRAYTRNERKKIIDLLNKRHINFIDITSNVEEVLLCDYVYVYDEETLIMEGSKESILKEEKILKRIGYGLPFAYDLALQLKYYNILNKEYYDIESLVHDLWN